MSATWQTTLWMRVLLLVLLAMLVLAWPRAAAAGGQCISAVNRVQGDVLVNRCNECRIAEITHKRRGNGFPLRRSYRIPASGKMELSFRGSGKTRVIMDSPCDAEEAATEAPDKDCAKLAKSKNGLPVLINACTVCRGVVLERSASNGSKRRQVFTMTARSMLPLKTLGAAKLEIVSELPCTR